MFHLAVKILVRGQHSGVAGEAAACDTAIPYGYQFISLLLYFIIQLSGRKLPRGCWESLVSGRWGKVPKSGFSGSSLIGGS